MCGRVIKTKNDPFKLVVRAVKDIYPLTQALIKFNSDLRGGGFGERIKITYPKDGDIPLIELSTNDTCEQMVHTLIIGLVSISIENGEVVSIDEWLEAISKVIGRYEELKKIHL